MNITLRQRTARAFTLMEVMIACGIFFLAIFAILQLVSQTLKNARVLRHVEIDAGMVAAQMFKTNRLTEGVESGDFGDVYRDYTWQTETREHEQFTNGLWTVDIALRRRGSSDPVDTMTIWVFSPESSARMPGRPR
jgi:Tfp pilus assembly protein PilV